MKKIFMLSWACALLISANALAEEVTGDKCGDDCSWTFNTDTGELKITGTGAMYDYTRTYDTENITAMDSTFSTPWDSYRTQIKSVDIGDNITRVGNYSFTNMLNVESVKLGSKIETLGYASMEWGTLNDVSDFTLPSSVQTIEAWALNNNKNSQIILNEGLKTIEDYAIKSTPNLKTLVIPSTVTSLSSKFLLSDNGSARSGIQKLYCSESLIGQCNSALEPYGLTSLTYKKTDSGYDVYNSAGKLVEQYASMDDLQHKKVNTTYVYDESGKLSQILDKNGVNIAPVTSYTVATATERVEYIGGCEEVKCSLKMWFK